jgi:hypothetical protein
MPTRCPECGRPCEEASRCPWCGADVPVSRGTAARLLGLVAAAALPFLPIPDGAAAARVAAAVGAAVVGAAASGGEAGGDKVAASARRHPGRHRHLLAMSCAALAAHALSCAFPGETAALGCALRRHVRWLAPTLAMLASVSGAARLPPLPSATAAGRLAQALKTPAVLALGAWTWIVAAWGPPTPGAVAAAALAAAAILPPPPPRRRASALSPVLTTLLTTLLALAFVAPLNDSAPRVLPTGIFAATVAALGLVQTLAGMKQTDAEPSNQP